MLNFSANHLLLSQTEYRIGSILEFLPVVFSRVLETFGFEGESRLIS
jgi:hypothetical protein